MKVWRRDMRAHPLGQPYRQPENLQIVLFTLIFMDSNAVLNEDRRARGESLKNQMHCEKNDPTIDTRGSNMFRSIVSESHLAALAINPILEMTHHHHHNGTSPRSKKIIGEVGAFLKHAHIYCLVLFISIILMLLLRILNWKFVNRINDIDSNIECVIFWFPDTTFICS